MSAAEAIEQEKSIFSITLTDMDYRQLKSFEAMLVSSVHAAEESLATAKNRYAIFSRMLKRIEEENEREKNFRGNGRCSLLTRERN